MAINKTLQKPEESVRRPAALDDAVLDTVASNSQRQLIAESYPVTIAESMSAVVSQIKQVLYGDSAGNWSDVPPISLKDIAYNQQVWTRKSIIVQANTTVIVDLFPLASFNSNKLYIEILNNTQNKRKSFEMFAAKQGSNINDSVYGKIGDSLDTGTNFLISGSDVVLEFVNGEAFHLTVNITRIA